MHPSATDLIAMRITLFVAALFFFSASLQAQMTPDALSMNESRFLPDYSMGNYTMASKTKLFQRNRGMIIGLQRGQSTAIELGGEAHWRKLSLRKPHIIGATANMEYHFSDHIIGYKAGMWMKRGRVNLTYGANLAYFTDFKGQHIYGGGPAVGFRLLGLHLINGYNFLANNKIIAADGVKSANQVNTLYLSLRYYFPVENKFVWDRKEKEKAKKKKEKEKRRRKKEKEDEKEERQKEREKKTEQQEEKRPLFGIKGLRF